MLNVEAVSALGMGEHLGNMATDASDGWGEL
jgi:hypothetical protein